MGSQWQEVIILTRPYKGGALLGFSVTTYVRVNTSGHGSVDVTRLV